MSVLPFRSVSLFMQFSLTLTLVNKNFQKLFVNVKKNVNAVSIEEVHLAIKLDH